MPSGFGRVKYMTDTCRKSFKGRFNSCAEEGSRLRAMGYSIIITRISEVVTHCCKIVDPSGLGDENTSVLVQVFDPISASVSAVFGCPFVVSFWVHFWMGLLLGFNGTTISEIRVRLHIKKKS